METKDAVKSLSALAQETRIAIYRLLVQQGPEGLPASMLAEMLDLPNATFSFHVKELSQAGLVTARQAGRFIYYAANYATMNDLVGYLTENCCDGQACEIDLAAPKNSRRKSA